MSAPKFLEVNCQRFLWRDLVKLRREQVRAAAQARQPALFELKDDSRPASQRSAAGRFSEPLLFTLLDGEGS
jgi:hypothetical protein